MVNLDKQKLITPKAVFYLTSFFTVAVFFVKIAMAWTNPSAAPPSGSGLITASSTNVGIGTTAPGGKLHVVGQSRISGSSLARVTIEPEGGTTNLWNFDNQGGTLRIFREDYAVSGGGINGAVRMAITNGGNVGIGTTAPGNKLVVQTAADDRVVINQTASNNYGYRWATNGTRDWDAYVDTTNKDLRFYSNTVGEVIAFQKSSGNVGIGTTGPEGKLSVTGDVGIGAIANTDQASHMLDIASTKGAAGFSAIRALYPAGGGLLNTEFAALAHRGGAWTALYGKQGAASSAAYFDGEVGIGTADPSQSLDVNGGARVRSNFFLDSVSNYSRLDAAGPFGLIVFADSANGATDGNAAFTVYRNCSYIGCTGGLTVFQVDQQGYAYAYAYYYLSDISQKKNIKPLNNSLGNILSLNGVSFDWKDSGNKGIGFIAQDVEAIFPDAVTTSKDTGLKSINYGALTAPIVEAIKEQQSEIEALKKEIETLKSQIGK